MKLERLRDKLAVILEEQAASESWPVTAFGQRRKVKLCRQQSRLENQIADAEFELEQVTK